MFTPSSNKGKKYQLFLPFSVILMSNEETFHGKDKQDMSISTQATLKPAENNIRKQQAVTLKKEADRQKAKEELKLDDRDIDDTMDPDMQLKIFEEICKQRRETIQQLKGRKTSSESNSAMLYPSTDQKCIQQSDQRYIPPSIEHPYQPILRAGEMGPLGHHLHVDRQEKQEHEDRDLQSSRQIHIPSLFPSGKSS